MKHFLIIVLLIIPISVFSQNNIVFNATSYAIAQVNDGYYIWSDWRKCSVRILFDLNNEKITIYSQSKQIYYIYEEYNNGEPYADNKGGRQIKFYVIDQDGDKGELRLRIESNGNSQLYIDFKDCAWCYNINKV